MLLVVPQHISEITKASRTIIYDALEPEHLAPITATAQTWDSSLNKPMVVFYENRDRVAQYLRDHDIATAVLSTSVLAKTPVELGTDEMLFLSEETLLPQQTTEKAISYQEGLTLLAQLQPGKAAVHADHGMGQRQQRRRAGEDGQGIHGGSGETSTRGSGENMEYGTGS